MDSCLVTTVATAAPGTLEMFVSLCDAIGDDPAGAFEEVLGDAAAEFQAHLEGKSPESCPKP